MPRWVRHPCSVREQLSRDHLSVISGISLKGKLFTMEQERAFRGEDVVRFLKHLLRQISGKLLVVWDGSPIHIAAGRSKTSSQAGLPTGCNLSSFPALRPGAESRGGDLEASEIRGAQERLLPESN